MRRTLAIVMVLLLGACGGRSLPDDKKAAPAGTDAGADQSGDPSLVKANEVDLVIEGSELSISVTDETGAVELQKVGSFLGACAKRDAPDGAVWLVDCLQDGTGLRLKFVYRKPTMIVLRAAVDPSNQNPGFDEYEMLEELPLPQGGRLRVNP